MKRNAIARIIAYSITVLILTGLLIVGLSANSFSFFGVHFSIGEDLTPGGGSADTATVRRLEIDWAAGTVTVMAGDTDQILFSDTGDADNQMGYSIQGDTLRLCYSHKSSFTLGGVSTPAKDLTVTVPRDWVCNDLELDGAALKIQLEDLTVDTLELDGVDMELTVRGGNLQALDCDGASNTLLIQTVEAPGQVEIDGASVTLTLYLPEGVGYTAELDGLSCSIHSDFDHTCKNGIYSYGNQHCRIEADGLSCTVNIYKP